MFTALEQVRIAVSAEIDEHARRCAHGQNSLIQRLVWHEAVVIANMTFSSRQDVEKVLNDIQQPFLDAEEQAADEMDQMVFQTLTFLHGATVTQLVVTERPLPQMLQYQFARLSVNSRYPASIGSTADASQCVTKVARRKQNRLIPRSRQRPDKRCRY